jgi:uncharacterized protein YeaO (DUF488 family)
MTVRQPAKAKRKPRATRISIKRVYEPASAKDGMRILVDRLWPRGMSKASLKFDAWPRDIAPSNELRKWYGHDPKRFAEFRRRYRSELNAHRTDLAALRAKLKGRTATLLTATREVDLSHATVLRQILERNSGK